MKEFHGDLLIGGLRLREVHGELEEEPPQRASGDVALVGHLHLAPEHLELLELNRAYRLQLDDGTAGQVVFSRIGPPAADDLPVDFEPPPNGKPRKAQKFSRRPKRR